MALSATTCKLNTANLPFTVSSTAFTDCFFCYRGLCIDNHCWCDRDWTGDYCEIDKSTLPDARGGGRRQLSSTPFLGFSSFSSPSSLLAAPPADASLKRGRQTQRSSSRQQLVVGPSALTLAGGALVIALVLTGGFGWVNDFPPTDSETAVTDGTN
jgi:hypothetical protein